MYRVLVISVQFCGAATSEPPSLNIYLNMFHQVPSPESYSFIAFRVSKNQALSKFP
jgi:hypothetical protein